MSKRKLHAVDACAVAESSEACSGKSSGADSDDDADAPALQPVAQPALKADEERRARRLAKKAAKRELAAAAVKLAVKPGPKPAAKSAAKHAAEHAAKPATKPTKPTKPAKQAAKPVTYTQRQLELALAAVSTRPDAEASAFKGNLKEWHRAQAQWVDSWEGEPWDSSEADRKEWWKWSKWLHGKLAAQASSS